MKIINNYDLMEKIDNAKNGIQLQKVILEELRFNLGMLGFFAGEDTLFRSDHQIKWAVNIVVCSTFFMATVGFRALLQKKLKSNIELNAYMELFILSLQLADINVSTTPDLLKKSEIDTTK